MVVVLAYIYPPAAVPLALGIPTYEFFHRLIHRPPKEEGDEV
ncbi:hypothetical protein [Actinomadura sp. 9N407]